MPPSEKRTVRDLHEFYAASKTLFRYEVTHAALHAQLQHGHANAIFGMLLAIAGVI